MSLEEINEIRKKYEDGLLTYDQYQKLLRGEDPFKEPEKIPDAPTSGKLPFYLQPDEEIVKDAPVIQYYGVGIINIGFGGGAIGDSGIGGGIFSSKQHKREKSIFDAVNCHVYLTNKRIVFVRASFDLGVTKETGLDTIFSDIPLNAIEGITAGTKLYLHTTIDLSVRSPAGEINKISFAFLDAGGTPGTITAGKYRRGSERDEFLNLIEIKRKEFFGDLVKPSVKKHDEDPIKILKVRFAKGEITKEEYAEMMNLLK